VVVDLERVRLRVPAGVADGSRLEVRGRGPAAAGDDPPGDLTIGVRVRPHPYFHRRGDDVHGDVPVTLAEAILGAEIEVPTIDGPVRVAIPPGISGGQLLRLRGRGIKPPRGERGDHYVTVRIVLPSAASARLRELLANLEQEDPRRGLTLEKL
jgi:DnaJ-class molecular chaperone